MSFLRSPRRQEPAIYGADTFARVRCVVRVAGQVHSLAFQLPVHHASPNPIVASSRDATAGGARNTSTLLHRLFPVFVRGDTPNSTGFLNLFGPDAARRVFGALHHLRQEPGSVFAILFRPCLSLLFIHADEPKRRSQACRTQIKGIPNP